MREKSIELLNKAVADELSAIQDVAAMLKTATQMEMQSIEDYNRWAIDCSGAADAISKQLFEAVIADEERHFGQFEMELDKLEKFGERYLVLRSMERGLGNATGDGPDRRSHREIAHSRRGSNLRDTEKRLPGAFLAREAPNAVFALPHVFC